MIEKFTAAFITEDRWKLYIQGLGVTIEVAVLAAIIGLILGTVLALMKLSKREDGQTNKSRCLMSLAPSPTSETTLLSAENIPQSERNGKTNKSKKN